MTIHHDKLAYGKLEKLNEELSEDKLLKMLKELEKPEEDEENKQTANKPSQP